jgi:hypothetical protein
VISATPEDDEGVAAASKSGRDTASKLTAEPENRAESTPSASEPEAHSMKEPQEEHFEKGAGDDAAEEQTKTLATNVAGESILEETIEKKPGSDEVKKVEDAKDEVIDA